MKLRSVAAWLAASAVAVSAMAVTASAAETNVIDFENGEFVGFSMKTDDGGDSSVVSVADYNGSKQLKVEIQDKKKVPKIYIDLDEIYGSNLTKVASISFDMSIISKEDIDGDDVMDPIGWAGGAIGIQADGAGVAWGQQDWTLEDYGEYPEEEANEDGTPLGGHVSATITRKNIAIASVCDDAHMLIMRWAAGIDQPNYDIYIDNVAAFDEAGNPVAAYADDAAADDTADVADETTDADAAADTADDADADDAADDADADDAADDADADDAADDADADDAADDADADDAADDADADDAADDADADDAADDADADDAADEAPADDAADETPAAGDVDAVTDSSKGSPDTGVADVAAVAGLAIVAAGAVVVAKKRK